MTDFQDEANEQRSAWARAGICLLNLLHPGLGLLRLARYKVGLALIGLNLVSIATLAAIEAFDVQITFGRFVVGAAVTLLVTLAAFALSIVLSWRWSETVSERHGRLWRWYGLLAIWLVSVAISWPFSDRKEMYLRTFFSPSVSMSPTLEQGDRFIARMRNIEPLSRGDVVIIRKGNTEWVKRIVAIPGDTVALHAGRILLNGKPVVLDFVGNVTRNDSDGASIAKSYRERLPGESKSHEILDFGETAQDNTAPVTLGRDQYFMMGDNRDNSLDSRFSPSDGGFGAIDRSFIEGKVLFRFWRSGIGLTEGGV